MNTAFYNEDDLVFRLKKDIRPYLEITGNFDDDFENALEEFYNAEPYYFVEWKDYHMKKVARYIRLARAKIRNEMNLKSSSFGYCS